MANERVDGKMSSQVRATWRQTEKMKLFIRQIIKLFALTWIVTGSDENLIIAKPTDDADVFAHNGRYMAAHNGHVLADDKLVVNLHLVGLVEYCQRGRRQENGSISIP